MARKNVKVKAHENLSDSNVEKVISLLESPNPITKKEACEILNISYNTTRLNNIIEGFKSKKAREKKMRDKNRGKPASQDEVQTTIQSYLTGTAVSEIAQMLFRSSTFVTKILEKYGVPEKVPKTQQTGPAIIPDECVAETFKPGQMAWSAIYHSPCEVLKELPDTKYEDKYYSKCYQIYIYESIDEDILTEVRTGGFHAYTLAYNLGSLEHIIEMGVTLT